jgi:hypothetical protein
VYFYLATSNNTNMSQNKLAGCMLLVVLGACTIPQHDLLKGKKWVATKVELPKNIQGAKVMGFDSQVLEFKRDSLGVTKWKELQIDWNNDSDRVYVESSFTYYRKGNSLFVKGDVFKEYYEQEIKELTDSTLVMEVPKGAGIVVHYTAQTK